MPKLNLDKNFINKLNALNNQKLGKSKPPKKISKISRSKTLSSIPRELPSLSELSSSPELILPSPPLIKKDEKFKQFVLKDVTEINLMWESFDDSIKKIVINEIIEKYYFYKNWRLNLKSFFLGILFSFLIILFIRFIDDF